MLSRLKEQLIRELGKNSHLVKNQNQAYMKKIQDLEHVRIF